MLFLDIKPLSVNEAWKGRRFKTDKYKGYERDILMLLPNNFIVPEGDLELHLEWGFSSAGSDIDNPVKPFQDCLQKKYAFNDSRIVKGVQIKHKVKKGFEYIKWELKQFNCN
ncbi:MAG TPA: hypothetical protein VIC51_03070 [Psychromonas sp.]